jgi:hypothetical protein
VDVDREAAPPAWSASTTIRKLAPGISVQAAVKVGGGAAVHDAYTGDRSILAFLYPTPKDLKGCPVDG